DPLQHRLTGVAGKAFHGQSETAASPATHRVAMFLQLQGFLQDMKLGVHVGYWGLGLTAADQVAIVQEAERLGYDSVWAAEAYGSDAATVLGWLAGQTSTIKIGSSIFQMPGRSATMTAMTAATLDQLSGGRMLLGI